MHAAILFAVEELRPPYASIQLSKAKFVHQKNAESSLVSRRKHSSQLSPFSSLPSVDLSRP